MYHLFKRFESTRPFSEQEAWLLFRIAAIAEAVGWTVLISGILIQRYIVPASPIPVQIAGQLHGTIFILYLVAAIGLYPSLGWSRTRGVIAVMASVPPYGSLAFEQWVAHRRSRSKFRLQRQLLAYNHLLNQGPATFSQARTMPGAVDR